MQPQQHPQISQSRTYNIINPLGQGYDADVFLVKDDNGKQYALKRYKSGKDITRFKKQAEISSSLDHQNLIKFIEVRENKFLQIIYEYASQGQIFDLVATAGRFSEKFSRTYFHQLISALHYMHKKGYAHRDIKPKNILISKDYKLKLADFGFSCLVYDNNNQKILNQDVGTKQYQAPQILDRKYYGTKVDIFAAGITLYQICVGNPPFIGSPKGDFGYRNLQAGKIKFFWDRRNKLPMFQQLNISQQFKDLFVGLINPQDKRFDINKIFQHSWMKGPTFSDEQLKTQIIKLINKDLEDFEQRKQQAQIQQKMRLDQEGQQGKGTRGIHQVDTFNQLYYYQMEIQRQIDDIESINLNNDFVVSSSLPYSFALLKDFFHNKPILLDEKGEFVLRTINVEQQKQDRLEANYQLKYEVEDEVFECLTSLRVVFGRTKSSNLALIITHTSGDRLYFKKIVREIRYLFALYLTNK